MIYASMVAIAAASLIVSAAVFLDRRPLEFAMFTWMATALFAVPTIRNTLPGNPPLGVTADLLVFLWAIVAVAVSLVLILAAWLQPDPRQ